MRNNDDIDGITIAQIKQLLNQFADDMDIFSLANEKSLKAIFNELEHFRKKSGFTISYDKTTLYRIGSLKHSNAQMYDINQVKWSNDDITVLGIRIAHDDIVYKNYQSMPEQIKNILNSWQNRGLSLLGKVQVINTLIASLFVYKMMVLPTIPTQTSKTIDNIIREFLWNGKKSKIPYNVLQNPKKEGGVNLVHLVKKDKSLKATWPQILYNESEYAEIIYKTLRVSVMKDDLWRCSIKPEDIDQFKITSQFWKEVWKSWSEYNYYIEQRIENQYIWYNSKIKINRKVIFWKDAYCRGLKYAFQLFENCSFKTADQMYNEYGISEMRFNSLKSAVPKDWKCFFTSNPRCTYSPIPPHNYDNVVSTEVNLSQKVYKFMLDDVMLVHGKYVRWREDLRENFTETLVEFGQMHLDVYKVTDVAKYRSFQYRLMQRGLVTNIQLHKWNIILSPNCEFCSEQKETIIHMFVECSKVYQLWECFYLFIQENYLDVCIDRCPYAVLFNKIVRGKGHVINFLCLVVKQYI